MVPFVMTGFVSAFLASFGAFFGELYAAGSGANRRNWSILGTWLATLLGLLAVLSSMSTDFSSRSAFLFVASLWTLHWVLVSAVATGGVFFAYEPRSANRAYWGVLLACLAAMPLTCWHMTLLMLA